MSPLTRWWYVACRSEELGRRPLARTILGTPIALFRDAEGRPAALLDRCPHRNVPLSVGDVVGGQLRCAYHGWAFDGAGRCRAVPGFSGEPDHRTRCAPTFPVREQQGFVWIQPAAGQPPLGEPFAFPHLDDRRYTVVRRELRAEASMPMMAENALDVPHTAFLHGGLFRNDGARNRIVARIRRHGDRVEAEYIGEPRPTGLAARLLSPSGGMVTHFDRFLLPSIVQVEYRIGEENHIVLNGALTPVTEHDTRLYAVVAARTRVPGWLLKPVVLPIALRIFGQDARILRLQSATVRHFGEEAYASTEIDLLGHHIARLLRQAADGTLPGPDAAAVERDVEMWV
jgi:phenylpropionate dioxygenase-like ring-hydroxylating dioxygenase large terminal subunit